MYFQKLGQKIDRNKKFPTLEDQVVINRARGKIIECFKECFNNQQIVQAGFNYKEIFEFTSTELPFADLAWGQLEAEGEVFAMDHVLGFTVQGKKKYVPGNNL